MSYKQTPSQTVGPFFAYGLTPEQYGYPLLTSIAGPETAPGANAPETIAGERIRIEGRVFDGEGEPVGDAMLEIWQADAEGRYAHSAQSNADREGTRGSNVGFTGFARVGTGTDPEQRFFFETVKPGAVGDGQAPHINVILFMRGMLNHAFTRIYFSDEGPANDADPVLAAVPAERRATLIAQRDEAQREESGDGVVYRFDIHMQGPSETVFFDV